MSYTEKVQTLYGVFRGAVREWIERDIAKLGAALAFYTLFAVAPLLVIVLAIAIIFKVLPDVGVAWRDVWRGAFITALLFNLGKHLFGLYLGRAGIASAYGAAGSLVIVLLWVYYSAQILLFGATLTQIYSRQHPDPMLSSRASPEQATSANPTPPLS